MSSKSKQASSQGELPVVSPRFDQLIDAATRPFRLGLLGGTFDPIHIGHLHIAERAFEQFALDGVLFIPTGIPAHKNQAGISDAAHRLTMVRKAISHNEHFDASTLEIEREGTSYTIDTLQVLKQRYGSQAELFYIVGQDMADDIGNWKDSDEVKKLVTLLVAKRTSNSREEPVQIRKEDPGKVFFIDTALIDVSSHELREWVKAKKSIRYLVPDAAYTYIQEQGLYTRQGE